MGPLWPTWSGTIPRVRHVVQGTCAASWLPPPPEGVIQPRFAISERQSLTTSKTSVSSVAVAPGSIVVDPLPMSSEDVRGVPSAFNNAGMCFLRSHGFERFKKQVGSLVPIRDPPSLKNLVHPGRLLAIKQVQKVRDLRKFFLMLRLGGIQFECQLSLAQARLQHEPPISSFQGTPLSPAPVDCMSFC